MFAAALLSLTGLPPTGGLVGKVYLAAAGIQGYVWLLLAALVIGSILGLFYYMRIVMLLFRQPKETTYSSGPISQAHSWFWPPSRSHWSYWGFSDPIDRRDQSHGLPDQLVPTPECLEKLGIDELLDL